MKAWTASLPETVCIRNLWHPVTVAFLLLTVKSFLSFFLSFFFLSFILRKLLQLRLQVFFLTWSLSPGWWWIYTFIFQNNKDNITLLCVNFFPPLLNGRGQKWGTAAKWESETILSAWLHFWLGPVIVLQVIFWHQSPANLILCCELVSFVYWRAADCESGVYLAPSTGLPQCTLVECTTSTGSSLWKISFDNSL